MSDLFSDALEHVTDQDVNDAGAILDLVDKHGLTVPDFLEIAILMALESIVEGD